MKYIDADRLIAKLGAEQDVLREKFVENGDTDLAMVVLGYGSCISTIATEPSEEVAKVRHGEWDVVYNENKPWALGCSACKELIYLTRHESESENPAEYGPRFCCNCGARMEGVE